MPACCLSQYYHFSQFSGIGSVQAGKQCKVLWNLSLCLVYLKSTGMEASSSGLCEGEYGKGAEEVKRHCRTMPRMARMDYSCIYLAMASTNSFFSVGDH